VFFWAAILGKSGLDECAFFDGEEGVFVRVGEVDDDEPGADSGDDGNGAFNDEDPSPSIIVSYRFLSFELALLTLCSDESWKSGSDHRQGY
jgi:hypothetical protein